jgi:hypothetical protein
MLAVADITAIFVIFFALAVVQAIATRRWKRKRAALAGSDGFN